MYNDPILLKKTAKKITQANTDKSILLGFDGTVDEIVEAVDARLDAKTYTRLNTIQDFADRIAGFASVSGNIEYVIKQEKLGGNGPIMANALLAIGYPVQFIGNIGYPTIHPIFKDMAEACAKVYSFAEPAYTNAVEFSDGKIMFTRSTLLNSITWHAIKTAIGEPRLNELFTTIDLIAANNWSQTTGMNEIWQGMIEILKNVQRAKKIIAFFDLADPRKRLPADIMAALQILSSMNSVAEVIVGLNKNEAMQIASLYNIAIKNEEPDGLEQLARDIRQQLQVSIVAIHPTRFACAASIDTSASVIGPYTTTPKLSTGAGDNFNAGFCSGLVAGFTLQEALLTGVGSSGYYVG